MESGSATITVAGLGPLGAELGSGGQGKVYALPRRPAQVYKEYSADCLHDLDAAALTAMVRLPRVLEPDDRTALLERTAWPSAVVERDGRVCGFVMALVPPRFHTRLRFPRGYDERLGQTQLLLNGEQYLRDRELAVDDRFRLELLHDVAQTLELFHRLGVVVGDLSPNNLLFSLAARPRSYFIDCDAMRLHGRTVLPQVETTDWKLPSAEPPGTDQGDVYKFTLFCVRLFAGSQARTDPDALLRAGAGVHELALRGLSAEPYVRPRLDEWRAGLASAATPVHWPPVPGPQPVRPAERVRSRPARPTSYPAPPSFDPGRRSRRFGFRGLVKLAVLALLLVYVVPHAGTIEDWVGRTFRSIVDATTDHAQAQADAVMQLLTASSPTRTKVAAAVTNLGKCKRLKQGASVLGAASAERRKSLVRAEALAVDDLSEGDQLKNQLVSAFKHSKAADDAYRRWAQALSTRGCKSSVRNGSDRRRGDAESAVATAAKKQVARLWNQIGPAYGHGKVSYQNI